MFIGEKIISEKHINALIEKYEDMIKYFNQLLETIKFEDEKIHYETYKKMYERVVNDLNFLLNISSHDIQI